MTEAKQVEVDSKAQSRVGKRPIPIPSGVDVAQKKQAISIKGKKGELERQIPAGVRVDIKDNTVFVSPDTKDIREGKRMQGLVRALISGMIEGVSNGFSKSMDLHGVGYRAELKGKELVFALGFSHPVHYAIPDGLTVEIQTIDEGGVKRPRLLLNSHNKELLGQTLAQIRSLKPPEPYKGKGFRIQGERIREKAGKAGAKTA